MDKDAPLLPLRTNATPLAAATMMATRPTEVSDARGYLHLAADAFGRLGAACWAQRARDELRATGEKSGITSRAELVLLAGQLTGP